MKDGDSSMEEEARRILDTCDEFFLFANFDDDTATTLIRTRDFQEFLSMYVEATAAALIEYNEGIQNSAKDPSTVYKLGAYFSSALFEAISERIERESKKKKKIRKSKSKGKVIQLNQNPPADSDE
ncbi:MAG: hypothetical protein IJ575_06320 [Selenomonadaceae bacterium]|nr:hypothetical protein [Selenomonadaceae bacterium]